MTTTDMAKRVGCSNKTIVYWIRSGLITAHVINKRYYITEETYRKFMEGHQKGRVFDDNR